MKARFPMLLVTASVVFSQTTSPRFEVVSVKPHPLDANAGSGFAWVPDEAGPTSGLPPGPGVGVKGNRYTRNRVNLQFLIMEAYGVWSYEISNLPDWGKANDVLFDVDAVAPGDSAPSQGDLRLMLQNLLADRFHLKVRRETRSVGVYSLTLGTGTPRLRKPGDDEKEPVRTGPNDPWPDTEMRSMFDLATSLSRIMGRPVVDHTGLEGRYEFTAPYTPDDLRRGDPQGLKSDVISMIRHIGLRLTPEDDPMDALVIDQVEKPTPN